jgi:uncharacterized membrane protein
MWPLAERWLVLLLILASLACGRETEEQPPAGVSGPHPSFRCQGNEPFWNLTIEGNRARYRSLAEGDTEGPFEGEFQWELAVEPAVFEWQGVATNEAGARLSASIREEQCLDSMSDETPAFSHWIRLRAPNGREVTGCCRTEDLSEADLGEIELDKLPVANLEALEADVWARKLMDLHDALVVCLGRVDGSGPRVTIAWEMDDGKVGARLRNGEGGWFECVASRNGGSIARFDSLDSSNFPMQHENRVVFTPAAQDPPTGNCYEHEKVVGKEGDRIGWLSFNTC